MSIQIRDVHWLTSGNKFKVIIALETIILIEQVYMETLSKFSKDDRISYGPYYKELLITKNMIFIKNFKFKMSNLGETKYFSLIKESTNHRIGQYFKRRCRDPRIVKLIRFSKGKYRNQRTAESV